MKSELFSIFMEIPNLDGVFISAKRCNRLNGSGFAALIRDPQVELILLDCHGTFLVFMFSEILVTNFLDTKLTIKWVGKVSGKGCEIYGWKSRAKVNLSLLL